MIIRYYSAYRGRGKFDNKLHKRAKYTIQRYEVAEHIRKWYAFHPYAKRLDEKWICSDYRIDQQRPQREVYSQGYIKIESITEMEEKWFDELINKYESKIEYPTVWDDGENTYYEETIYCPKCGKRRKVLTSKTHCEECGFEFEKAKKCPKCKTLNLKENNHCTKCNYKFHNESYINNKEFKVKTKEKQKIQCPKCGERKSKYYNKCPKCGFNYDGKKQCHQCKQWVDETDKFCVHCGVKLTVLIQCPNCGEKIKEENKFCNNCGTQIK